MRTQYRKGLHRYSVRARNAYAETGFRAKRYVSYTSPNISTRRRAAYVKAKVTDVSRVRAYVYYVNMLCMFSA
jgi:hypothetical protein